MERPTTTCPLCKGVKKVFHYGSFVQALRSPNGYAKEHPSAEQFVMDCSVCAGNGWIETTQFEFAKEDAKSWRHLGIKAY